MIPSTHNKTTYWKFEEAPHTTTTTMDTETIMHPTTMENTIMIITTKIDMFNLLAEMVMMMTTSEEVTVEVVGTMMTRGDIARTTTIGEGEDR
jgi:hypothetical protein